jgi:hypothetical protein
VSEFYINPELLRELDRLIEPTIRALREAQPVIRFDMAEIARTLGPTFLAASGVAKLAADFANRYAELNARQRVVKVHDVAVAVETAVAVSVATLPKPTVAATGKVTEPTLLTQFAALPCGQQIAVVLIILAPLLYLGLPADVQAQIAGLITVLGAALWLIGVVTKK